MPKGIRRFFPRQAPHSIIRSLLVCAAAACATAGARADLQEDQVLLLWNGDSTNDISEGIRNRYVQIHPGVHDLNLNLTYIDINSIDPENPPADSATEKFITPLAFEARVRQVILDYIEQNQLSITCFVTTRGVPALVTSNFAPPGGLHGTSTGVKSSFESALSMLGLRGPDGPGTFWFWNPYRGSVNVSFDDFAQSECLEGVVFMASRIDGGTRSGMSQLQVATALLDRTAALPVVNKFLVTIVMDDTPPNPNACASLAATRAGAAAMREQRWCVFYDQSPRFLNGASEPAPNGDCPCTLPDGSDCEVFEAAYEGHYSVWPELVHSGLGSIHDNASYACVSPENDYECVSRQYARYYNAHPAGLFSTVESFNGIPLWGGSTSHGNGLEWIGYSEGSFALLNAYGPFDLHPPVDSAMLNLYVHGLSWGEAALSAVPRLGYMSTPIGDPLATVQVFDPDLDGDGFVSLFDVSTAINIHLQQRPDSSKTSGASSLGGPSAPPPAPPSGGSSSAGPASEFAPALGLPDDIGSLLPGILQALGRYYAPPSYGEIPEEAFPTPLVVGCDFLDAVAGPSIYRCLGDLNFDLEVDDEDLALFQHYEPCGCDTLDLNGDTLIDAQDLAIVSTPQSLASLADADDSGTVDCDDYDFILANFCSSGCDPELDFNCDGVIDFLDAFLIESLVGGCI